MAHAPKPPGSASPAAPATPAGAAGGDRPSRPALSTLRALVVDDEENIRALLARLLEQAGLQRIEAIADGRSAIEAVKAERVDLMLLDLAMPGATGEEVARETLERWPDATIIVITGHGTIDSAVDLMKAGVFDFLRKPFEFRTLRATLAKALEKIGSPELRGPRESRVGRFVVVAEIASGGMGTVYRARDPGTGETVAVKVLHMVRPDPEHIVRFQVEGMSIARLRHPNIVSVRDTGLHDGKPYLAMEYIEGVSLGELIYGNRLSFRRGLDLLAIVGDAVEHAHQQGVLHRDLKPSNVLVDTAGIPHVIDFGLAKFLHASLKLTRTDLVLGTFGYLAPERLLGTDVDEGVDVYSLGAILYEMLTHRLPYERENDPEGMPVFSEPAVPPSRWNPVVPPALDQLTLRAIAVARPDRHPRAADFAADVRRFLKEQEPPA
ncbi:MAG: response regulator [Planctomycetales bacterium]|nr:response regulator [Planctomycetales bacterium]